VTRSERIKASSPTSTARRSSRSKPHGKRYAVRETTVKFWRCYRCGKGFIHARYLANHLMQIHAEGQ
jgi:ribosomal protein L37AE/L43A